MRIVPLSTPLPVAEGLFYVVNAWCFNLMHNVPQRSIKIIKYFVTFALICIAAIAGTKLVFMLFNLGEMGWGYFVLPIAFYYVGAYGFPFLKSKGKE